MKRQLSLEERGEPVRLWDINDPRAQRVYNRAGVTAAVKKELAGIPWFSFTTDIWSTEVSNDCLVSLPTGSLTPSSTSHQCCMLSRCINLPARQHLFVLLIDVLPSVSMVH